MRYVWNKELTAAQVKQNYYSNIRMFNETKFTFISAQALSDGNHVFRGIATSRYGLMNYSTVMINLDTTVPVASFVAPTTVNGYKNTMWISANVTASDRNGIKNVSIYLFNDTNSLITKQSTTNSRLFVNFTNLGNRIYRFTYTVYDNYGLSSSGGPRYVAFDNITPRTGFTFPPSNGLTYGYVPPINMTIDERNLNYTNYTVTKVGSYVKNYTPYDNSLVFMSSLDNNANIGDVGTVVVDTSRYKHNGTMSGSYFNGKHGKALAGTVTASNIPADSTLGNKNTVEFWTYYGYDGYVFSFSNGYGIKKDGDCFGVTTDKSFGGALRDIIGATGLTGLTNKWVHVVAVMPNGVPSPSSVKLYLNGKQQSIGYCTAGSSSDSKTGTSSIGMYG